MEFDFIIKVKHRETLRRFNAYGTGNILHLNMDELRAKIIDLFNFKPEAHFDLTYIDDDGDTVMLVDDADLWDASISQHLNPLRITVQFAANGCGKPRKSSLGDSLATTRSSHLRTQLPSSYTDYVKEVMGTGQHPFHDALLKLSGASVGPLTEFVESLSKLGLSYLCLLSQRQDGVKLPMPCIDHLMDCNQHPLSESTKSSHHVIQSKDASDAAGNNELANGGFFVASALVSNDNKSPMDTQLEAAASTPVTHPCRMPSNHCNKILTHNRKFQCNACEMKPIVGPRFKSKVKQNYNLCNVCFSKMGDDADCIRIDRVSWSPQLHKKCNNNNMSSHIQQFCRLNLDSSFVEDVTISDGTRMAPQTSFTKIWRMRNSGAVVWPSNTQLVWIGGDQFGDQSSIESVIPKNGYPVGEELDIAVHCTAPSSPGKYISYWTMALPSGQKFGQHIWVLIKVSESQDFSSVSSSCASLNLSHGISGKKGKGINIMDDHEWKEPIIGANIESSESAYQETKPRFDESPIIKQQLNLEADFGGLIASNGAVQPLIAASASTVQVAEPPSMTNESVMRTLPCKPEGNPVEQALLRELEEMGFQQTYLNKEVLRLNNYNLEQSVEDLCKFNN